MYKSGKMFNCLAELIQHGKKVALLIIDEEDDAAPNEISNTPGRIVTWVGKRVHSNVKACQQRILMYMQSKGCPVWSITSGDLIRTPISALYNGQVHHLKKRRFNAFNNTTLHLQLQSHCITHLIIMGWNSNVCVQATVGMVWYGMVWYGGVALESSQLD